jgi:hypothetical protein
VVGRGDDGPFDPSVNSLANGTANPVRRDTVTVPAQGWTVIRFRADNPGVWMFHCHIEWHRKSLCTPPRLISVSLIQPGASFVLSSASRIGRNPDLVAAPSPIHDVCSTRVDVSVRGPKHWDYWQRRWKIRTGPERCALWAVSAPGNLHVKRHCGSEYVYSERTIGNRGGRLVFATRNREIDVEDDTRSTNQKKQKREK